MVAKAAQSHKSYGPTHGMSASMGSLRLPELLAPAGDWECARAAVENGADAIYFGLEQFNARMRANNFTLADLPRLMEFLHRRGVRGYVTLNTLVFEEELAEAENHLRPVIAAGVDAVIVQDVGLCTLVRELSPDFPIHASTQMTITSSAGVDFVRGLGCQLVVLARELSIPEIERIQAAQRGQARQRLKQDGGSQRGGDAGDKFTSAATGDAAAPMPLEVFVHGALCVAYSGQCLTSEALGGRSANRGECAQACRLPYDLIADGQQIPLGDRRYLLSPQDLAGVAVLDELARVGVASLKIEGRLKSPEYVANITRVYRKALDQLAARLPRPAVDAADHDDSDTTTPALLSPEDRYSMEMAFSRGLFTGWFEGVNNRALVHARFGKKRGVQLGTVRSVRRNSAVVDLVSEVKPGDGVVFDAGRPEAKEEGGRVYEIQSPKSELRPGRKELFFGRGDIDFSRIHVGDKVWKTSDPALEKQWRQSYEGDQPRYQRPVCFEVHGVAGGQMTVVARDEEGHVAQALSNMPLAKAAGRPLTSERLRQQLGRLGGTPFRLGQLANHLEGELMLPVSELNRLRRGLITELDRQRAQPKRWTLNALPVAGRPARSGETNPPADPAKHPRQTPSDAPTNLIVLVRKLDQLDGALRCGIRTLYCDFENPKEYRDAVTRFRHRSLADQGCGEQLGMSGREPPAAGVFVAPPRIFKPGDDWQLEQVRSCSADGYLVRNYDHLRFFRNERCVGDFSLNVANHRTAQYFLERFGLERITASYDLNFQQLEALLRATPPGWFEVTIHQHMPMFHMEHCVFCAFLSDGKDYRDCGRPCDRHDVRLRDRVGAEHPVKADVGCRNTVFNGRAQSGAEYVDWMRTLGVRHLRIEFLNESAEEVQRTIAKYRQLLRGEITGSALWQQLKLFNQLGVTRGTLSSRASGS